MSTIQVGDAAPVLPMHTHDGETISLADYHGRNTVVLFFYPRDETPICTREACSFRDAYEDFTDAGAVVIGASGDAADSHQAFARNHNLPFLLVSDTDGILRRAFGLPTGFSLFAHRTTFVIDPEGIVRHRFQDRFAADRHVKEALTVVQMIAEEQAADG